MFATAINGGGTVTLIPYHKTKMGAIYHGDSLDVMKALEPGSVDLIMTSPPFGLTSPKEYGNEREQAYLDWFNPFAESFHRILKDGGSLVIDLGGAWKPGAPVRSLYHWKLLIMLCEELGFHLAQEFYWWNPSKIPGPAEWVTIRRIRVKDSINTIWWLSKTEWPRASNRRVLQPYSPAMKEIIAKGISAVAKRPSGHTVGEKFCIDNGGAIPTNLLAIPSSENNSHYQRYCRENGIKVHPARFPSNLPEYFIRMLTDPKDKVIDPFAGTCVTGEVAERLDREWICVERVEVYLKGALGRFVEKPIPNSPKSNGRKDYYSVPRPGLMWNDGDPAPLAEDGGRGNAGRGKT